MRDIFTRHAGLLPVEDRDGVRLIIIGCGGIGSHTALALARMGYKDIVLVDDDVVDDVNVSSQGFNLSDVGLYKVDVVRANIRRAVGTIPLVYRGRATSSNLVTISEIGKNTCSIKRVVYILAVDSMAARLDISTWLSDTHSSFDQEHNTYVINPAMGGEYMTMDCYDMGVASDRDALLKSMFSDDEGVQDTCTTRATIYTTLLIASVICKAVKDMTMQLAYVIHMAYDIQHNSLETIFTKEIEHDEVVEETNTEN